MINPNHKYEDLDKDLGHQAVKTRVLRTSWGTSQSAFIGTCQVHRRKCFLGDWRYSEFNFYQGAEYFCIQPSEGQGLL